MVILWVFESVDLGLLELTLQLCILLKYGHFPKVGSKFLDHHISNHALYLLRLMIFFLFII